MLLQTVYNFAGMGKQVAFDIFCFDGEGKIAEHWDNLATKASVNPSGHSQIDGYDNLEGLEKYKNKHVLYLELGVGGNTPIIIKYPFWQMVYENSNAVYACLNYQESYCPKEIVERSICVDGDIFEVLQELESKGV